MISEDLELLGFSAKVPGPQRSVLVMPEVAIDCYDMIPDTPLPH